MKNTILATSAVLLLASCTADQRASFPVIFGFKKDGAEVNYDPKGGLSVTITPDSAK